MNPRCPKCDCELVRAANETLGTNTVSRSLLVCSQCGAATIDSDSTDGPETLSFDPADTDEQIAHFTLRHRLGSGGFGDVWHAIDQKLGRSVALKLSKSRRREPFSLVFEAQTAASLRHPHIVSVHEVGEVNGRVYIASDLIEGMTLGDFLSAGKPQLGRVIQILVPICRALHFAHTRGVYHRDVKPANILLDHAGQPYVTDFGLAKRANDTSSSSDGRMVGTVRYMSPEQAIGNIAETDGRSDIYALGVTLFEMLTGETPFRGNAQAILHQKAFDDPPSPRLLDPSLPKDLETICLKCLERDPGKRFGTAAELADELDRFAANEPILSRPISRMERAWRWCQKRPAVSGLMMGLFISLVTGLLGVSYFWRTSVLHEAAAQGSLYRSWMNMAGIHLRSGDSRGVRETLSRVEKDPALAKLIGFEWNYYHSLMKPLVLVGDLGMPVVDVAITYDGDYCAATGGEQDIHVWSVKEPKRIRVLAAENASFQTIDFSPVNAHLASGSLDGYVRIYDPLSSSNMIRQLRHGPQVTQVRYSPDGSLIAAAGRTGAVRVWNVADASLVAELPTGRKPPSTTEVIRYSPNSALLYVASADGLVRAWDLKAIAKLNKDVVPVPKAEYDLQIRSLTAFSLSTDGQFLTGGNYYGTVSTLSLVDGGLSTHATRWGRMDDMEPIEGNDLIAIATNDGLLHVFNRKARNDSQAIHTHSLSTEKLSQSRNRKILVFGSGDGAVSVIKVADLMRPTTLWHEDQVPVRSIDFAGPTEKLLAAYENGELRLWNTEAGTYQQLIEAKKGDQRLVTSHPRGGRFVTASIAAVEVWDINSLKPLHQLSALTGRVVAIQFSATGNLFVVAYRNGHIRVYATDQWDLPLLNVERGDANVSAVEFIDDDSILVIAFESGKIELVNLSDGASVGSLMLSQEPSTLRYCAAKNELVIGTNTGELIFWVPFSDADVTPIKSHSGRIHTMRLFPSSATLITAGRDHIVRLWDVASRELTTAFSEHYRQVFSVSVSFDEKTMASGSLEGDIRIWRSQ